ncbi:MAG: ABC transporter ATP-binding protein [Candidatus Thermoplasmatota archaeon]|nr:ABC transporter ATP-binding protein [Candidatus Thermoplasmatota archaeon]
MVMIRLDEVTTGYKEKKPVLKELNLAMEEDQFIGVVGPNGSGKSTLVKCITRVLDPWEGTVKLDGEDISGLSRKQIAKTAAVVPQDTFISFPYSAKEVVLMGRSPYLGRFENYDEKDQKIAERAMKNTQTYRFRERKINELSGGEMQRVIVARALTQEPDLLLLDEATSHLDIGHKKEIMDTIKEKNEKEDLSVLSVHHNLNLAARYCDKILLLDEGEKHAFGRPEKVLTNSHLRAVYGIEAEVHEHPKDGSLYVSPVDKHVSSESKEKTVHVICGGGSANTLLKDLVEEGYEITAGVLNVMDSDFEKADFLDIETVTEAPFSSITERSHEKNLQMIKDADILLVTDFPVGDGNRKNIEAVEEGVRKFDKEVLLIDPENISDRDYTSDETASRTYDEIIDEEGVYAVKSTKKVFRALLNFSTGGKR